MRIGYARVSTGEQNLEAQVDALKKAGCDRVVSEKVSTRKEERKKLQEALSWLRDGDTLVCTKMDRLARSMKDLISITDRIERQKADVAFLDQRIDTSQAGGRLIFHIFAAFAEFERDMIRERTMAGLAAARARGRKGGRKRALFGKRLDTALKMYDSRQYLVREICESLGVKERTFYDYLKRRRDRDTPE